MDDKQETGRNPLLFKPRPPRFFCTSCWFPSVTAQSFTEHLSGEEHGQREIMIKKSKMPDPELENADYRENQRMRKKVCPTKKGRKKIFWRISESQVCKRENSCRDIN
ncbi:unnamed protein product [Arabidopsis halleri]